MSCSPWISRSSCGFDLRRRCWVSWRGPGAAFALLFAFGCAGSITDPAEFDYLNNPPDAGPVGGGNGTGDGGCDAVTTVFVPSCATSACHSASTQQGKLDLETPGMPQRFLDAKASGGPGLLIDVKNPAQSVLYLKTTDIPPFKFQMPLGNETLTADQSSCLQSWIEKAVGK